MEFLSTKSGGNSSSSPKGRAWGWWFLVILFPIPFSPWWLTIICVGVFGLLCYVFTREEGANRNAQR
jgi:hypothetical protein